MNAHEANVWAERLAREERALRKASPASELGDLQRQGDLGHDLRFLATTVSHSFNAFGELLDLYKKVDELGGHATRVQELLQTLEQASDADGGGEERITGGEAMLELAGLTVTTPDGSGLGGSGASQPQNRTSKQTCLADQHQS